MKFDLDAAAIGPVQEPVHGAGCEAESIAEPRPQWEPMATSVFDDEGHISVGALPSVDGPDICGNVVVEHDKDCKHMGGELHRSCWR